jgi:hypothetical protein
MPGWPFLCPLCCLLFKIPKKDNRGVTDSPVPSRPLREFGTNTGFGGGFVPEGLNENRQGLQPLFREMKKWRAVGTPRFAAYLTAREMGGGQNRG